MSKVTILEETHEITLDDIKNTSIDIDDKFNLMDIRNKCPYDLDKKDVLLDIKRCFCVCDSTPEVFLFKDYDAINDYVKVSYTSENIAKSKLKKIIVGNRIINYNKKKGVKIPVYKKISAWDIYLENTILYTVKALKFYSEDPQIFSYFRGYDYNKLDTVKQDIIQPFLDHVLEVICDNNQEIYKYVLIWIASILQKPNFKTEIAIVILGNQGVGKNTFFTNIICKLMARYANKNVTNIENIVGKFNATLENKKLLVLNELQNIDVNKFLNSDALKSVISDDSIDINQKNEPVRHIENVANFFLVSNNDIPIKIDDTDRRYLVLRASDKHMQDFNYFDKLASTFTPEFYENLFTFFMMMNTKGFNLRNIPNTVDKENIKEASMSSYELFVRDNYDKIDNISGPILFAMYNKFVNDNKFKECSSRTFIANIKKFTGPAITKRINGKVCKVYTLKPEYYEKYKKYYAELEEKITEEINDETYDMFEYRDVNTNI